MNDTNEMPALKWEPSPAEMHQARLSRLVNEAEALQRVLIVALAEASCIDSPPSDPHETDVRIIEGDFANARRALFRLTGVKP